MTAVYKIKINTENILASTILVAIARFFYGCLYILVLYILFLLTGPHSETMKNTVL